MLRAWERAAQVEGLPPLQRSAARNRLAITYMRVGKPALAVKQAEMALVDARDRDSEFETLQLLALAQAAAGRKADAEKTLALLTTRAKILPSDRETRRIHWARGEIALLAGDTDTAIAELNAAQKMLPVHGPLLGPPSSHGELWLAAALANIKGGRDADAARLLERLQSGHERLFSMDPYVRSFYLLGQIYERLGDTARARDQYRRFVQFWRDGDLERGWVAEAQKKLENCLSCRNGGDHLDLDHQFRSREAADLHEGAGWRRCAKIPAPHFADDSDLAKCRSRRYSSSRHRRTSRRPLSAPPRDS